MFLQGSESGRQDLLLLLRLGSDINGLVKTSGLEKPLPSDGPFFEAAIHLAAREGSGETVWILSAFGAALSIRDTNGMTALAWASRDDRADVVAALVERGASVDRPTGEVRLEWGVVRGWTPAMFASACGSRAPLKILLAAGANINAASRSRVTALMLASEKGSLATVSMLLQAAPGADVNASDSGGMTALLTASKRGHVGVVRSLVEHHANVNASAHGRWTALMLAARVGRSEVVQTLLSAGAQVDASNIGRETALMLASRWGFLDVVKPLLASKASVNASTWRGWTALMFASRNGHAEIVRLLVAAGADTKQTNTEGKTALEIATGSRKWQVVSLLSA
uniref:Uncharacterized protein n=1 Tax=Chromera velia CCMP2878 TaxID=1169474 RepID=A0A0G4HJR4_9ALVE|eukprot:Cvel_7126.t1-p1 / transcript=Cvel_7126.t1 / gene=Cvel_7126 / organism=Chromera_velia_CCMP2878 / gene_product=Kinase D-interacting substrate of 220 kDa, putative / transcript_product=Kinase D-interacting substrate of 220 kDa, putative / location=Cvel_scaffold365:91199-92215(-) / protein_length=339 / sequence_SO=supercontig / SO=protein_coding / is_pseudo=false